MKQQKNHWNRAGSLKRKFKQLLALFLLLNAVFKLSADSRYEALNLENAGNLEEAQLRYIDWLKENANHTEFADVLLHVASLSAYVDDALNLLRIHVKDTPREDQASVYSRLAWLEAAQGNLSSAAEYYRQATLRAGKQSALFQIEVMGLQFSMGEYERVRREARKIKRANIEIEERAVSLAAISLALAGSINAALSEISYYIEKESALLSPLPLMALRQIAIMANKTDIIQEAEKSIASQFPLSIADYMVSGMISSWLSPASLFQIQPVNKGEKIQLGAFSRSNGAQSFLSIVLESGFSAWVEEDSGLWRVFTSDAAAKSFITP